MSLSRPTLLAILPFLASSSPAAFAAPRIAQQARAAVVPSGEAALPAALRPRAFNPLRVALLRWWDANEGNQGVPLEGGPAVMAFDGQNMWVGRDDGNLTAVRTSGTAIVQNSTHLNYVNPGGVAYDGEFLWMTSTTDSFLFRVRAEDGVLQSITNPGVAPVGVAYDGKDVWVAARGSNWVMRLRSPSSAFVATYPVPAPEHLAYDGRNMWVTSRANGTVQKLRGSDGVSLGTFPVGSLPERLAFDGSHIWVVNSGSNDVTRLRASDGAVLGTFSVGTDPHGPCPWRAAGGSMRGSRRIPCAFGPGRWPPSSQAPPEEHTSGSVGQSETMDEVDHEAATHSGSLLARRFFPRSQRSAGDPPGEG